MGTRTLHELLSELAAALRTGSISDADRAQLQQLHTELSGVLAEAQKPGSKPAPAPELRTDVRGAIERLEEEHPRLTSVLSRVLDTLSELGV
jgi:hypothetical protein